MSISLRIGGAWVAATRRVRIGGAWLPEVAPPPDPAISVNSTELGLAANVLSVSDDEIIVTGYDQPWALAPDGNGMVAFRIDNAAGKRPLIRWQQPRSNFLSGSPSWGPALVWFTDPTQTSWNTFTTIGPVGGEIRAQNATPFVADTVYVCCLNPYLRHRWEAKIPEWLSNPLAQPTESAINPAAPGVEKFVIANLPGGRDFSDVVDLPPYAMRAWKVGTGPIKIAISCTTHPVEMLCKRAFERLAEWVMGTSADAIRLRETCTVYFYPSINPYGEMRFTVRSDGLIRGDFNRQWVGASPEPAAITALKAALVADAGSVGFSVTLDMHNRPQNSGTPRDISHVEGAVAGKTNGGLAVRSAIVARSTGVSIGTPTRSVSDVDRLSVHFIQYSAPIFAAMQTEMNAVGTEEQWFDYGRVVIQGMQDRIDAGDFNANIPATSPAPFTAGQWTLTAGDGQATLTINTLPGNGGSAITALQYRIGGGTAVTMSGTGTGARTITGLTNGVEVEVQVRAVNAVNANPDNWSDTKSVTPFAPGSWAATPTDGGAIVTSWPTKPTTPAWAATPTDGGATVTAWPGQE